MINEYLLREMWSTPGTIKSTASSIKKCYKSMMDHGIIGKGDYNFLCESIRTGMPIWQEDCEQFNDPNSVNPFMPFW